MILREAKTDKRRDGQTVTIACNNSSLSASNILHSYIGAAGLKSHKKGALFRKCVFHSSTQKSTCSTKRVTYSVARSDLQKLQRQCTFTTHYTWHSFRAGAASEALNQGTPLDLVQAHGRWATLEGMGPYIERTIESKKRVSEALALH